MSPLTEYKLCKLYEGMSIAKVLHRLEIASKHIALKQLNLRVKIVGLPIGD